MRMGNSKLNPTLCTEAELRQALAQAGTNFTILQELITYISEGGDLFTFKITTNDTTPGFWHDSAEDQATYSATTDTLVYASVVDPGADEKFRQFIRLDAAFYTQFVTQLEANSYGPLFSAAFYDAFWGDPQLTLSGIYYDVSTNTLQPNYSVVKAQVNGAATTQSTTFNVDGVVALYGSRSPGSTITGVVKLGNQPLLDNAWVTLIYNAATGPQWELLHVERLRALRGQATATATVTAGTPFNVDTIRILDSGLDPRTDPTSNAETLAVYAVEDMSVTIDDDVWADFNVVDNRWEARPKARAGSGGGGAFVCTLDSDITAGTTTVMGIGTGTVYEVEQGGTLNDLGTRAVFNPFPYEIPATGAQYTCSRTYTHDPDEMEDEEDDEFTIVGLDVLNLLLHQPTAAASKSLYLTGTTVEDFAWGGAPCDVGP